MSGGARQIFPAAPIQQTCATIGAGPDHACVFESMPTVNHLLCFGQAHERCAGWFDGS